MKRVPMVLMLIAPYFLLGMYMAGNTECLPVALLAFGIVMVCGAVYAFFLPRMGFSGRQILFWSMLLKICNIPVFLLVFAVGLLLFVVIIPLIPLLVLFDCFLLLATSMYAITGIIQCGREKGLSKKEVVINIVLQFFFCLDVFSAVYCYIRSRRSAMRPQR